MAEKVDGAQALDIFIKNIRSQSRIGILECSAACDQAWRDPVMRLFLLVALIQSTGKDYIGGKDSVFSSEQIYFDSTEYIMSISFRYPIGLRAVLIDDTLKWQIYAHTLSMSMYCP